MTLAQASSTHLRVELFRADRREGLKTIGGVRSWTTSRDYAEQYRAGRYGRSYGGSVLYRAVAAVDRRKTVDLRHLGTQGGEFAEALHDVLDIMGVEDIADVELHVLLQEAIPVLQAYGLRWVVFREYEHDEWLSLGGRVRVQEVS